MEIKTISGKVRMIQIAARALMIIWAAYWIISLQWSGFFDSKADSFGVQLFAIGLGVVIFMLFFASVVIPWRREFVGGIFLVIEGLAFSYLFIRYSRLDGTKARMLLSMGLPPIVAGILFLIHDRLIRASNKDG